MRKIKITLLIFIALLIYFLFPIKTPSLLYIYKNAQSPPLKKNYPLNFIDLSLLKIFNTKEGWIRVPTRTKKYEIIKIALQNPREKTRTMIMYGGATIEEFVTKIAKQAKLKRSKLLEIYNKYALFPEASIIAKHYNIPYNTNEISTMEHMLNVSYLLFLKFSRKYATPLQSKKFKEKVIIASIIEKETQNYKEMPLIASVIYNRLQKGMRLQMDATLNYKQNSHKIVTPEMIKKNNSAFNSYKHKGLPPEPIASISKASLEAAFNPAQTDYLYFVKSKDGKSHTFSKVYKSHLKKVKKYKTALRKKIRFKKRIERIIKQNLPKAPQLSPLPSSIDILNPN